MTLCFRRMRDLFWGRADFEKNWRVRGLPPRKLITFDPFVSDIIKILVSFLDFVIFFLSRFFSLFFGGGAAHPRTPLHKQLLCLPYEMV